MLGQLFGSNARVKILKIFLFNPEEKYYIRELARKLKLQVNSVRRELDNLEKFGILVSGASIDIEEGDNSNDVNGKLKKGKSASAKASADRQEKKYYKANADFVLFEEIKSLIIKAQVLYGQDFIKKLKRAGSVKLLVLTGKFVNKPDFPVDLLIVGRFNKVKLIRLIKELEKELGREVNYTLMDTKEFRYRRDITDIFLYSILEGKSILAVDEMGLK
jgi:DNA-binding transcriptional regulator YhcF (GntR family)